MARPGVTNFLLMRCKLLDTARINQAPRLNSARLKARTCVWKPTWDSGHRCPNVLLELQCCHDDSVIKG